jgi:hypothetical protein
MTSKPHQHATRSVASVDDSHGVHKRAKRHTPASVECVRACVRDGFGPSRISPTRRPASRGRGALRKTPSDRGSVSPIVEYKVRIDCCSNNTHRALHFSPLRLVQVPDGRCVCVCVCVCAAATQPHNAVALLPDLVRMPKVCLLCSGRYDTIRCSTTLLLASSS